MSNQHTVERSRASKILWGIVLPLTFAVLLFFSTLPLRWKDQAVLGFLLVTAGLLINRLFKSRVTTLFLTLTACFCTARYAYYRYSETYWNFRTSWSQIHAADAFFVLLLIVAETYSFIILFLGCIQTARPLRRRPTPLPDDTELWPTVDVFVPTYNEPLEVVTPTVLAALTMDWPAEKLKVYILDDGRRSDFQEFASECGATYMTRLDNSHAKAGNINTAFEQTTGEFVAIFDCDHIPTRSFLQMTMGTLLADERNGMVQTPHHFYSADPFERNLGLFRKVPNESALFYGIIQDGSDLWDSTFFCGSCAVLRRTALEEIGGIAVETVTEDAHTALRMQAKGWSTSYINLPQAAGLATSRLADHVGQRIRWARGMVQILRVDNPLFKRGLKWPQRVCYLNSMMHYLFAGPRLIFLTSPLVYLILGFSNVFGYLPGILAHGLPHLVLATMVNSRVHGRHRHSFWNEVYEIVLAPYIFLPTLLALINPKWGKFNVTAKKAVLEGSFFDWQIAKPFAVLLLLNIVGIAIGARRIWIEGDPQGVLAVNLTWAFFNAMTLGAALAVAYERKQVRSTVRVNTKLAMQLILPNGETVAGRTDNLSMGGLEARVVRSGVLNKGDVAKLTLSVADENYTLPVKVVDGSGSLLRMSFGELDLAQQAMLTRITFARADCWLDWSSTYQADRPLLNLMKIAGISLKGVWFAIYSLFPKRSPKAVVELKTAREIVVPVIALLLLLQAAFIAKGQSVPTEQTATASAFGTPSFRDVRDVGSIGHRQGALLRGKSSRFTLYFGLPITRLVSDASLALRYRVSPSLGKGSRLTLVLNGSPAGSLPVQGSGDSSRVIESDVPLSAELFVAENSLAFELTGVCGPGCQDGDASDLWIAIEPSTEIRTAGSQLPMPNRLSLLPAPFVGPTGQRVADIPFVFDENYDTSLLQAAGVAASWFGMKADYQGVRFPVSVGKFPAGNFVLLATRGSVLAASLGIDLSTPSVSVRNNPNDPFGKVLAITAGSGRSLIEAARAFALERYSKDADTSLLSLSDLPAARTPYDAPRWLSTSRDVRIAESASDTELQVNGSGTVNLYFRLPPDLYYGTRDTVPLHLKYRCSALTRGSKATVKLYLNGQQVGSRPVPSDSPTEIHEEIVYLPVAGIFPKNTLSVEFAFERVRLRDGGSDVPVASVLKSTELMVKSIPHFAPMPRLDMFANTGFPFTRFADLSETLVALSPAPKTEELSLYLTLLGFMGAQTGYPALRVSVARGNELSIADKKDILIIAPLDKHPLFREWSSSMLVRADNDRVRIAGGILSEIVARLPWSETGKQRKVLDLLLGSDAQVDGVVEGFGSPIHSDRSIVAVTSLPGRTLAAMAEDWASVANAAHLYGTTSVFTGGRFHSFTLEEGRYHFGSLDLWPALQYWVRRYYWLSPILIFACTWLLTLFCDRWLEARAAARLQLREPATTVSL